MIYKLIIGALLLATILYYFFCFLEIFGVIKFTDKNTTVKIHKMFIPSRKTSPLRNLKNRRIIPSLSILVQST